MAQAPFSADIKPLFSTFHRIEAVRRRTGQLHLRVKSGPRKQSDRDSLAARWRAPHHASRWALLDIGPARIIRPNGRAADTSRDLFSRPKAAPIRVGREGSQSLDGIRGGVKNWWSTLTMRASATEYRSLHLRAHELLRDVPLYDVSSVDLPGGGSGRTIADIRTLESATPPSRIATFLYGLRYLLGRVFGWDREPMRPEDSFLERLSQRDRCDIRNNARYSGWTLFGLVPISGRSAS